MGHVSMGSRAPQARKADPQVQLRTNSISKMAKQEVDTLETALEKMAQRPVGFKEHHQATGSPTLGVHSGWMTTPATIGGYLRQGETPRRSGSTRAKPDPVRGTGIRNPRQVPPGQPGHPYAPVNPPPHHRAAPY